MEWDFSGCLFSVSIYYVRKHEHDSCAYFDLSFILVWSIWKSNFIEFILCDQKIYTSGLFELDIISNGKSNRYAWNELI